jgi:hypothetical protein
MSVDAQVRNRGVCSSPIGHALHARAPHVLAFTRCGDHHVVVLARPAAAPARRWPRPAAAPARRSLPGGGRVLAVSQPLCTMYDVEPIAAQGPDGAVNEEAGSG